MPFYCVWMDCSLLYVLQFFIHFFFLMTFYLVLSSFSLFGFIVLYFSFKSFLFPYWAVFPARAFGFLTSGSSSWGLQSGM